MLMFFLAGSSKWPEFEHLNQKQKTVATLAVWLEKKQNMPGETTDKFAGDTGS